MRSSREVGQLALECGLSAAAGWQTPASALADARCAAFELFAFVCDSSCRWPRPRPLASSAPMWWLSLLSVVLLAAFSCVLVGVWVYTRAMYAARQKELADIREHKQQVKKQRQQQQQQQQRSAAAAAAGRAPVSFPSPDESSGASPPVPGGVGDLHSQRRRIDVRRRDDVRASQPLLGNASPIAARATDEDPQRQQEEEAALLR